MVLARGAANIADQLFGWHTGGWGGGFLAHLHSPWGYDEPEILRYSNRHFGPIGADAGHPKGIGALFVRREIQYRIHPHIHGGGQQRHLRSGTLPTPLCVGMGVAAQIARSAFHDIVPLLRSRRNRLVNGLKNLKWRILLNGPGLEDRHPGNANVQFEGFSANDILAALQPNIAAATGSACTSGVPESSHVLRAIGLSEEEAEASVRFSVGRHTTDQDIDEAIDLLDDALHRLAKS